MSQTRKPLTGFYVNMFAGKRKILFFLLVFFSLSICARVWSETNKGIQLFTEGKFSEAKSYFEKAFRDDTTNHLAAFYLGRLSFITDDYNKAVDWLEKSVQLDNFNYIYVS